MNNYTFKIICFTFLIFCISACGSFHSNSNGRNISNPYSRIKNAEPGMPSGPGCYAKCLISDKYTYSYQDIFEYTGDDINNQLVEEVRIEILPSSTNWVKKKADPNCSAPNPDDCLVWCLVENEAEYQNYYVVKDTSLLKEFKKSSIETKTFLEKGGYTQWKEIVCAKDQTSDFYASIQDALSQNNYDMIKAEHGVFDKITKNALIQYQKENDLPSGNMDLETIESLGIEY